jgi:hypothetical protein
LIIPDYVPAKDHGVEKQRMNPFNIRLWLSDKTNDIWNPSTGEKLDTSTIPVLNPQAWDELVKSTKPECYWWFAFIIILKLAVNMIYVLGTVFHYDWEMWLQALLCASALLSHFFKPYIDEWDNRLEQTSFLGIVMAISATKMGLTAVGFDETHAGLGDIEWPAVGLVTVVLFTMSAGFLYTRCTTWREKVARQERVQKGEESKSEFRSALTRACRSKLLNDLIGFMHKCFGARSRINCTVRPMLRVLLCRPYDCAATRRDAAGDHKETAGRDIRKGRREYSGQLNPSDSSNREHASSVAVKP